MKKKRRIILRVLIVLLLLVFGVSVWQFFRIRREYALEAEAHRELLLFRPGSGAAADDPRPSEPEPETAAATKTTASEPPETTEESSASENPVVNEWLLDLQESHPNAIGWLTVPGTEVDYPFVQGPDNNYFLRRDIDGKYQYAGIPFLDWQCRPDFSGDNTIIYGHNLRNEAMFGSLERLKDSDFLNKHHEIFVYLPTQTIHAEIVACLVVSPSKFPYLYRIQPEADHLTRALADARAARPFPSSVDQRFITLSTCDYEFGGARVVILAVIDSCA